MKKIKLPSWVCSLTLCVVTFISTTCESPVIQEDLTAKPKYTPQAHGGTEKPKPIYSPVYEPITEQAVTFQNVTERQMKSIENVVNTISLYQV